MVIALGALNSTILGPKVLGARSSSMSPDYDCSAPTVELPSIADRLALEIHRRAGEYGEGTRESQGRAGNLGSEGVARLINASQFHGRHHVKNSIPSDRTCPCPIPVAGLRMLYS